jgi:Helix-turn-helix domain
VSIPAARASNRRFRIRDSLIDPLFGVTGRKARACGDLLDEIGPILRVLAAPPLTPFWLDDVIRMRPASARSEFMSTFADASHLMITSSASQNEIALSVGFSDQAHLSRLFRQAFGQSPSRWRRNFKSRRG